MRLRFEARPEPSRLAGWLSPVIATAAVVIIGFVLFSAMGKDPWQALYVFFIAPIDTVYNFGELLLKASPMMLVWPATRDLDLGDRTLELTLTIWIGLRPRTGRRVSIVQTIGHRVQH